MLNILLKSMILLYTIFFLIHSEAEGLASSVVKVINPGKRFDGDQEIYDSSSALVAKEILVEAPDLLTHQLAHLLRGE